MENKTHDEQLIKGWLDAEQGIYPEKTTSNKKADVVRIAEECVEIFNLNTNSRRRDIVYRRFYLCYKLRDAFFTLHEIADIIGKDHSTVFYAVKQHEVFEKDTVYEKIVSNVAEWLRVRGM